MEEHAVPILFLLNIIVSFLPFSVTQGGAAIFSFLELSDEFPASWPLADSDGHVPSGFMFLLDEVTDHVGHILVRDCPMREIVFEIARHCEISELFLFGCKGWVPVRKFDVLGVFTQKGKCVWSVLRILLWIR